MRSSGHREYQPKEERMNTTELPDHLRQRIQDQMERGERIVWVGQPIASSGLPHGSLPIALFGLVWTLFSLFWMAGAAGMVGFGGQPVSTFDTFSLAFAAFGIPFVLIGIGMLSAPFWTKGRIRKAAARTAYLITDRQAIVIDGGFAKAGIASVLSAWIGQLRGGGIKIRRYAPTDIINLETVHRDDGSGDVLFGESMVVQDSEGGSSIHKNGFFSLQDVRNAERLLRALASSGAT
jgi:hypothetical protein